MGEQDVKTDLQADGLREFMQCILTDLRAFEQMLESGRFETGMRRIGAEQELVLVNENREPAMVSLDVLERIDDPHFTTELGRFNIEFNTDPIVFGGGCLRQLEAQLVELFNKAQKGAQAVGADAVLVGILPTLRKTHLDTTYMTPRARYRALNEALTRLRGAHYDFRLTGIDELSITHDSVMLEACNTSFQVHFQVDPDEFVRRYNVAQAVAAPVLAAAANSPLMFGKRLWRESRIGLFQQAVDTRTSGTHSQERKGRVSFGDDWVRESVLEIYREDISRFRLLFGIEVDEDPFEALGAGRVPALHALRLHNGTVYRWNRPCYGVLEGKPHLRIENRVLPAGPTIVDSVANAAFWFGLMSGVSGEYDDITQVMDFDVVKENFIAAARGGLHAQLYWIGDHPLPARELICQRLLPLAREGLKDSGIDANDIDRYLGIIRQRVSTGRTGADWQLHSLSSMRHAGTLGERMSSIVGALVDRQRRGQPVHEWEPAQLDRGDTVRRNFQQVEQYMTTDVITANQDDSVGLVANMMDWEKIRHIPIEDNNHHLVGLVTYRQLIRFLAGRPQKDLQLTPVSDIMLQNVETVTPETGTIDAIHKMRSQHISCLPVIKEDRLVGIVTETDFLLIAADLIERELTGAQQNGAEQDGA